MTFDAAYIDQIVQNVMREMKSRVDAASSASAPVSGLQAHANAASEAAKPVMITSKVISEGVLLAAKAAGNTITLQSGAIITPSGKEYIRKNGVQVSGSTFPHAAKVTTGVFLVVGSHTVCQSAAAAAGWTVSAVSCEHDAARAALAALTSGITVTFGGEPSIVACLLNRNPDVRAAVITKATNLNTLTSVMSPQAVCLDSSGWSFGDILRLLRSLSAASRPHGWKEV
ncbi:MAG: hypothetical protein ACK58L_02565 [Planctomycetota bacterium]